MFAVIVCFAIIYVEWCCCSVGWHCLRLAGVVLGLLANGVI